ncbi:MAG: GNAT family N-acetyltransferase [Chloroflexales bacterium]|nr:GNAT family N-acetyltransferase [Chloroflexales bacterium]
MCLRPLVRGDLDQIRHWTNDPQLRRLTGQVKPMTETECEEFYQRTQDQTSRVWFIITLKATGKAIGEAGLLRMFPPWRTTDLTMIIGEREERGKGYGTEAINLLLEYAFGRLNFHRVALGVVGFNEAALRFYAKAGFTREGVQRDGYYYDHTYHDFVMMSLLEEEYRAAKARCGDGTAGVRCLSM